MKGFYSMECTRVTLVIPTSEEALASMSVDEMVSLLMSNDRNADWGDLEDAAVDGEGGNVLRDAIRHDFGEALNEDGIDHSLNAPSWEE